MVCLFKTERMAVWSNEYFVVGFNSTNTHFGGGSAGGLWGGLLLGDFHRDFILLITAQGQMTTSENLKMECKFGASPSGSFLPYLQRTA